MHFQGVGKMIFFAIVFLSVLLIMDWRQVLVHDDDKRTYFLYFLLHYLIAIKVEGKILFSNKVMLGCSAGIFSAVILGNVLIDHIILRILVVLLLCGAGLIHEEKTLGILKRFWRSNR